MAETEKVITKDLVCGMSVAPDTRLRLTYQDTEYFFCSIKCLEKFKADPDGYISGDIFAKHASALPGATYICPMCPDVWSDGPGSCPTCGMALEPAEMSAEEEPHPELDDMRRRFVVSAILTLPVFIIAMTGHIPGNPLLSIIPHVWLQWIEFVLATPVVVWCGFPLLVRAVRSVATWKLNMFTLIGLGLVASYGFSLSALFFPGFFPDAMRLQGFVGVYFEAAAVITTLVLLGQVLELRARAGTRAAIRKLLSLAPKTARVISADGSESDCAIDKVKIGDRLRVRPGERVPVDGVVLEGSGLVDESMISGEAVPVSKRAGNEVIGATINTAGSLVIEARHVGADTMLAQIVLMVAAASRSRAPVQKLADAVAGFFVPIVVLCSIITFFIWLVPGHNPAIAFVNACAVLVIACPCALGLATPMSVMVASGRGAESGVLFRNAEMIEILEKVDMLVIDKTGTITEGKPSLAVIEPAPGFTGDKLLYCAASLERGSEHPLAAAIIRGAEFDGVTVGTCNDAVFKPGKGIRGIVDNREIALGTSAWLRECGVGESEDLRAGVPRAEMLRSEGHTIIFAAIDRKFAGLLALSDKIKPGTAQAVALLQKSGIAVIMATGDALATARVIAGKVGIETVYAGVLPGGKADVIKKFQAQGRIVAMAGDGINDAPALAQAQVGIAMATGTDIAMESAGITLVGGDLIGIVRARALSSATMKNIRQNLFFAFVYNALGIPIAAGALFPLFGILLSPMIAAAAMSFSSISVIGNALRLRSVKL
ncbi:MAG: heavy metal translocating P-type ATPase [Chitinispirillaceae bacterium]|nr:heavy metal translocating P-type ATPase [Chitinispirillaceae bacterium]